MKKIAALILVVVMILPQYVFATTMYTMYDLNGHTIDVKYIEIEKYRQDGWYYGKPVTMYALDGRTLTIGENDIGMYKNVGWYYGKPVTMYSLDGRTLIVGENDIDAQRQVGWYYGKPITMYATDGRTITIGENDVGMYKKSGWLLINELDYSSKIRDVLTQFDYINVFRSFINAQGENWSCAPVQNQLLPFECFNNNIEYGKFEDAYVVDIDNDDVLELVALFSSSEYGAAVIYECLNGNVFESFKKGANIGGSGVGWYCDLVKNNSKYGFVEHSFYRDYETEIRYYAHKLDKGYEGITMNSKNYTNNPEWNEYYLYNKPTSSDTYEEYSNRIAEFENNSEIIISLLQYNKLYYGAASVDQMRGQNLEKYCIYDMANNLNQYAEYGKPNNIPDLILGAFYVYQNGYYYEALQICDQIKKISGITDQQLQEVDDIVIYCNNNLFVDTTKTIENISNLVNSESYYEALAEIEKCKQGMCSETQLSQLVTMETICKDNISAYEMKMNEYTAIYAKSGMIQYVINSELEGYLRSGVWFLAPVKTFEQMKKDAYEYVKTSLSAYLYYPESVIYPGINDVTFYKSSQDGSQAEYVMVFNVEAKNSFGWYVKNKRTFLLRCNPYGFYSMTFN